MINAANIITSFRIVFSAALLCCPVFSPVFYILYLASGITDMTDGTVARKTNTVSKFGERLDSAADMIFVLVCFIRLIPVLDKLTGALLFILPLTLQFVDLSYSAAVVCCFATFSAVQEGHYIRARKINKT